MREFPLTLVRGFVMGAADMVAGSAVVAWP